MPDETTLETLLGADDLARELRERRAQAEGRFERNGWNDPVVQAMRSFVKLEDGASPSANWDDPGARCLSFDAKTATARFLVTTRAEDRHGDVVESHGCKGRLERYVKNPVVFFGHKSWGLPIGSAVNKDGVCELDFNDDGLVSPVRFHLKTQESEDVCRLVEAGELRAASIGFIPMKAIRTYRKDDPNDDTPKNEVKFEPYVRFRFKEWELLEWSVVGVPANSECVALRLSKGFGGRALAPAVVRYLEPFAAPAKVWAPGWTPEKSAQAPVPAAPVDPVVALKASFDNAIGALHERLLVLTNAVTELALPKAASPAAPASPVVPSAPAPAQKSDAELRMLALVDQVKAGVEKNAKELRRITGRVD